MGTRRQFLLGSTAAVLYGLTGGPRGLRPQEPDGLPDGSAAKNMITPETQRAIDRGLDYLADRQGEDGRFGTGNYTASVAITSLAGLAMMAGGHLPGRGAYGPVVSKALRFILDREEGNRGYFPNKGRSPHGEMYGHGFATLFLAELYGMVHARKLREELGDKLRRAVDLIIRSQNSEGGWRYTPESKEADISVTICQIMALRAARNAGLSVPKATVDRCVEYVKRCQDPAGWFRYMAQQPGNEARQAFARTAAGVVALYNAGIYKGPELESGLNFLMQHKPSSHLRIRSMHYFYGHYYAAQAMWTAGGDYWKEWYPAIRDELLHLQNADGSWSDPTICRHYATAMACIILQIPNNLLPILQK
jgi:hypothetical protein